MPPDSPHRRVCALASAAHGLPGRYAVLDQRSARGMDPVCHLQLRCSCRHVRRSTNVRALAKRRQVTRLHFASQRGTEAESFASMSTGRAHQAPSPVVWQSPYSTPALPTRKNSDPGRGPL